MSKKGPPKPENTKEASRFKPRPCRACLAISKSKCMFCGQSWNMRKMDMTDWEIVLYDAWVEHMNYLKITYQKLITFKMKSTGCESLDQTIIEHIGDWRTLI